MIDLARLCEQANELAPLPASTVRLAELIGDPNHQLDDVTQLIKFDQALTMNLLRAANCAASGPGLRISDVGDAVYRLGGAQVLALAVAAGTRPLLQKSVPAYGLDEGSLWRHSVAAAVGAETLQTMLDREPLPEAFTAALLHDLGKLIMGRFLSPEILGFIRSAMQIDHLGQLEAESLILKVNHGELGGLIAQHWHLPPRVVQGIIYHHNPLAGNDPICDLTYLADQLAKRIEAGTAGQKFELTVPSDVLENLGLSKGRMDAICPVAASRFLQVSRRYNAV
jgi:HD-like signal output (HDOD) protein